MSPDPFTGEPDEMDRQEELSRRDLARIAELEAEVAQADDVVATVTGKLAKALAEVEWLRGLLAEMLALNPIVSGDMEKVRVWAATLKAVRAAMKPVEAGEGE